MWFYLLICSLDCKSLSTFIKPLQLSRIICSECSPPQHFHGHTKWSYDHTSCQLLEFISFKFVTSQVFNLFTRSVMFLIIKILSSSALIPSCILQVSFRAAFLWVFSPFVYLSDVKLLLSMMSHYFADQQVATKICSSTTVKEEDCSLINMELSNAEFSFKNEFPWGNFMRKEMYLTCLIERYTQCILVNYN